MPKCRFEDIDRKPHGPVAFDEGRQVCILDLLPHISRMLREDLDQVLAFSDTIIVGHSKLLKGVDPAKLEGKTIFDLAGLPPEWRDRKDYYGVCW